MISIICGIVNATGGTVSVAGHDIIKDYRKTRELIGLVPQELTTESFESVLSCVKFSRGLFGKPPDDAYLEDILKKLTLWSKKDDKVMMLSGGMKRRLLIAKALSHKPRILFLDEPTAGVDVELRKDMWNLVRQLREDGVTIILTTHYIEEAEEIADRIGVISGGKIIVVEDKVKLMANLGTKQLIVELLDPSLDVSEAFDSEDVKLEGSKLIYSYDPKKPEQSAALFLESLKKQGIAFSDFHTKQSSLEEIFVKLVRES